MFFFIGIQMSNAKIIPVQVFESGDYSGLVKCIFQDHMGFVWIGKENGLFRYDGYELRTYKSRLSDSTTISSDNIQSIAEDVNGNLWIGTRSSGLNFWNRKTAKFTRFIHDQTNPNSISFNEIYSILPVENANVWIGTDGGGLNYFDASTHSFTSFKVGKANSKGLTSNKILQIIPAGKNKYWLGTWAQGLFLFNSVTKHFDKIGKNTYFENSNIYGLSEVKPGILWISTDNKGLLSYDVKSNSFTTIIPQAPILYLSTITTTSKGEVYVASNQGLFYFETITSKPQLTYEFQSLNTIFLDNTQTLWVGNRSGMVGKINSFRKQFHSFEPLAVYNNSPVSSMCADPHSGNVYFSSYNYFIQYNPSKKEVNATSLPKQPWFSLCKIVGKKDEFILVAGSSLGLRTYNRITKTLKPLKFESSAYDYILDYDVKMISPDSSNGFWVGAHTVAYRIRQDEKTGIWKILNVIIGGKAKLLTDSHYPTCFIEHSNGDFFIGTAGAGLNQLTHSGKQVKYLMSSNSKENELSNNFIESMAVDKKGNLLLGTQAGLNRFNVKTSEFSRLLVTDGLVDNWISAIKVDEKNRIWISTRNGISRISQDFKTINSYNTNDGLISNFYLTKSVATDQFGNIYFGSTKGVIWFHPDSISDNPYMANAMIVGFEINEKNVEVSENSILKQSIELTNEIVLKRDQSSFSFQMAALNFLNSEKNKIEYKLEGYDDNWQLAGADQKASYSKVSYGNYTFRVRVSNDDGVWNPVQRILSIKVIKPFWMSWYAILLYILILAATYYYVHRRILKELDKRSESGKIIIQSPINQEDTADQKFIKKAFEFIIENIDDHEFGVLQLAEKMNCSRPQLYRKVIAITGISVSEFIKQTRITKAAQYLLQKTGNISDVAYKVGFDDPGYFGKCFKKHYGVTPARYIADHENSDK